MRISDWSSDVCSSDLRANQNLHDCVLHRSAAGQIQQRTNVMHDTDQTDEKTRDATDAPAEKATEAKDAELRQKPKETGARSEPKATPDPKPQEQTRSVDTDRSEEHTSELQSLMRTSYA